MCLYTSYIRNKKYIANKKNGGIVPAISDWRTMAVPVKCGECMECQKQRTNEWKVRLFEEIKNDKRGWMATLTFSEQSIIELANDDELKGLSGYKLDNGIAKLAVHRFRERYRKKYRKPLKRWLVTEIGGNNTERIHMHGIIFTDQSPKEIAEIWGYGNVKDGRCTPREYKQSYVSDRTINYISKYITKKDFKHPHYKSWISASEGFGKSYAESREAKYNAYVQNRTQERFITRQGHELQMPVYLRNKIYTEEQREKLWIEKLDKGIMYIMGRKIDISRNMNEYTIWLENARKKNKLKGYGDGKIEKSVYNQEQQIRALKQKENWGLMGMKWDDRATATL